MKNLFTKKQISLVVACASALGFATGAAAQSQVNPLDREVWVDVGGPQQVWRNAYGECWRAVSVPSTSYNECSPAPVAQYVPPPPPPVVVAPPPPPVRVAPPPPPPP
ncbi:MAG: hypothetical protein H7Y16_09220, partial [Candidatus Parcubacteria bacterium]|nr:hypothetical protein [Burkholderiales bacterium]